MSVLGKRKRNETELDGKEDDHSVSNSPPKKRLRSNNDSNHNNKNSKVEMEIDAEQKKVPSFTMQAVINEDFETITDKNLEGNLCLNLIIFRLFFLCINKILNV